MREHHDSARRTLEFGFMRLNCCWIWPCWGLALYHLPSPSLDDPLHQFRLGSYHIWLGPIHFSLGIDLG